MKKILLLTASVLLALSGAAESFSSGNFTYTTTSDTTVELTAADIEEGEVTIPETVTDDSGKTYTVTSIGASAFMDKRSITAVTMPNTVTRIGNEAFKFCMSITKVHLSENLEVIGANAFQTTRNLTEINWPVTLKSVQAYAFQYSSSYAGQIRLPKGVSVDNFAFVGMEAATSVWLDGQPSSWGTNQFQECGAINSFYVNCLYPPEFDPSETFPADDWSWSEPAEITLYVPRGAKDNYLANAKWATRFETIEEYDFTDTDTTNPGGGYTPDDREYETYTDTWSGNYTVAKLNVASAGTLKALLGDHVSTVKEISLSGKLNGDDILCLREMAGVSQGGSIINGAILEKIDLTNCEIVEGGEPYFSHLDTYYTAQDAVGPQMFASAYALKSFSMPKYAQSIGKNAFAQLPSLTEFNCNETVKSVGELAFYNCTSIESIQLPDCCSQFGDMVFYVCPSLKYVHLPSSMTSIPFATFYYCHSLPEVNIPDGVQNIENLAFHQCLSLKSLHIPAATYKVSATAISYCTSLTEITIDPANANYCDIDGVLFNKLKTTLINYPSGKQLDRYEVPAGTVTIGDNAMAEALFRELSLPEGLTTMAPGCVFTCNNLELVEIPSTLTNFDDAIYLCKNLQNYEVADANPVYADIDGVLCNAEKTQIKQYPMGRQAEEYVTPAGITEIGDEAFAYSLLQTVTMSDGVKKIGTSAFALSEGLTTLNLAGSVEFISLSAFSGTALSEVHCDATVPPVCEVYEDEGVVNTPFDGVEVGSCKLYVPAAVVDDYKAAEVWRDFDIVGVSGIESIETETSPEGATYYTIDGRPTTSDTKGILIVRTADGRVYKTINR